MEKFEKDNKILMKKENYNAKHYLTFKKIKDSTLYKFLYVTVDLFVAIIPILILNIIFYNLNELWYFLAIVLCGLSCIDPFLSLNFMKHKITKLRRNLYSLKFLLSIFISILALIMPMLSRKDDLTLE